MSTPTTTSALPSQSPLSTPSSLPTTLSTPYATSIALGFGIPAVLILVVGGFIAVWCHCRRPKPQEERTWIGIELREGRLREGRVRASGEVQVWWCRQPQAQDDREWIGNELRESRMAVREDRPAVEESGLRGGGDGRVWWL